ncbi:hypothetical protein C0992_005583 [Termitomyces sp. T32_za158]|nr:hypothetical protein C0992_005583 [Termitomyces sp. T32_za158]
MKMHGKGVGLGRGMVDEAMPPSHRVPSQQPVVEDKQEEPLSLSDVDQLLQGPQASARLGLDAASGILGISTSGRKYMRSGEALGSSWASPPRSPSLPVAPCWTRQRSTLLDPYQRETPDRIPTPLAHENDVHAITLSALTHSAGIQTVGVQAGTLSHVSATTAPVPLFERTPGILLHDSPAGSLLDAAPCPGHVLHSLSLEGGCSDISLNLLTDEACHLAAHELPPPKSAFVISNGKLRLLVASFNISKEDKLSFDEWCGASDNLVEAMHKHLWAGDELQSGGHVANVIVDLFAHHFKYLKNMNNMRLLFLVVLHYDRHLRGLFLWKSYAFCMDTFQNVSGTTDLGTSQQGHLNTVIRHPSTPIALPAVPLTIASHLAATHQSSCERMDSLGNPWMAALSATLSTASPTVTEVLTAIIPTSALCVAPPPMGHNPALLESLFPLSTPLKADRWEVALLAAGVLDRFAAVPMGIQHGFSIGLDSYVLNSTFTPKNHYRTPEAHDFIISKYAQEIALGRISPVWVASFGSHSTYLTPGTIC